MSLTMTFQEATDGPDLMTIPSDGYVHLLNTDTHSNQSDVGYFVAELSPDAPYSFERWLRAEFTGTYSIRKFRFWAELTIPAGWEIKWGASNTFATPVDTASSIAVNALPTSDPGTQNCGGTSEVTDGTHHSEWIVLQAHVPDFSAIEPGPMLGTTGGEVINPALIAYHFTWTED